MSRKPCKECPFRRVALPGYLGNETDPWHFAMNVLYDNKMPCHLTVDYENEGWREDFGAGLAGELCEGSLIFARNTCKLMVDPALKREADKELVFSNINEFIVHHKTPLAEFLKKTKRKP